MDRRITIFILLLLVLINVIFFAIVRPLKSSRLKTNHAEETDEVVFITNDENYLKIQEVKQDEEKQNQPVITGSEGEDGSFADEENKNSKKKPAIDDIDDNASSDDETPPPSDDPEDPPEEEVDEPVVPDPFLD